MAVARVCCRIFSMLNFARIIYGSEGGIGEAYYAYDGTRWARWETDFPQGDDNLSRRLTQLTRINVNPIGQAGFDIPDLADFPMLYISDPGLHGAVESRRMAALRRYLAERRIPLVVDDFWGDAEWQAVRGM